MRFNVYGRYELDVERRNNGWVVYRCGAGKRREDPSIFIPSGIPEHEIVGFLEDLLHEEGHPGGAIRRVR